jgi:protein TonB
MQWALVISLVLHGGAAGVVIYFSGFSAVGTHSTPLIIQEIELSPLLTAPMQPLTTPSEQHHAMAPQAVQTPAEAEKPRQESSGETQAPTSENAGKEGGLIATPLGLGMTHGYFSMLADGKTLRDDVRAYYFTVVEKINREWWDGAALLKEPLHADGVFEIVIRRDGTIEALQLVRSTGSREADRLIAEILRKASPLPPLPSTYPAEEFRIPLKIKAPLSLFRFKN